ncbi:hypothetical protein WP1_217 [Pseudomonas phage WP1]
MLRYIFNDDEPWDEATGLYFYLIDSTGENGLWRTWRYIGKTGKAWSCCPVRPERTSLLDIDPCQRRRLAGSRSGRERYSGNGRNGVRYGPGRLRYGVQAY